MQYSMFPLLHCFIQYNPFVNEIILILCNISILTAYKLSSTCRFRVPYQDDPLFNLKAGTSAEDVSISSVMRRYNARNCESISCCFVCLFCCCCLLACSTCIDRNIALTSILYNLYALYTVTMRYVSQYAQVERRQSAVPSDHSAPNYFNASMVIRIPAQPIR